jgi:RNA polymerase sigma-70 factor (ECF subfamily)
MIDANSSDESALIARLKSGDGAAFEELVRMYGPRLLRVARRMLPAEEDARDAVQDAFVAAFKSVEQFEAHSQLATWLHRIVVNAALMRLRTQRRRPEEDIEQFLPRFREDGHQIADSVPWLRNVVQADSELEREEARRIVRASIDELPDAYRMVLLLRDIEELSTEEAARILGVTANAVKVRLHRARQALRTLLDPYMRATP